MILEVSDIREAEKRAMEEESITSLDLMERAGASFVESLYKKVSLETFSEITVFCGPGNNGGDGLVIGRLLSSHNRVHIVLCNGNSSTTHDFDSNLERIRSVSSGNLKISNFDPENLPEIDEESMVIDALFGIGISRPVEGYYGTVVDFINSACVMVVSVDVPSGLFPDRHTPAGAYCIQATLTLTFQFQKLAFLLPENADRVGQVTLVDIGLTAPSADSLKYRTIDSSLIRRLWVPVPKFAHKGTNGHGMLIAGSSAMPGAALLAAKSALKGGIGKVTVHTAGDVARILAGYIPEALLSRDQNDRFVSKIEWDDHPTVNTVAIGPGLGKNSQTSSLLSNIIDELHSPIIMDADALNILSENKTWLGFLTDYSILTPHFKEFERLTGAVKNDFERLEKLITFATRLRLVVVLKGANTVVATPDGKLFFNTTGNQGMATAGSGDVLTGLLLALCAKGYRPEAAAIMAVFIHGLAADIAIEQKESFESLIASDIIEYYGEAYKRIEQR